MDNFSDRSTVGVHVYGQDLVGLDRRFYNLETGQITWFRSEKFDNC